MLLLRCGQKSGVLMSHTEIEKTAVLAGKEKLLFFEKLICAIIANP
jgi:hypothetical protein